LASGEPPLLVDVRAPREREQKFIDGSVSMPLNQLPQRAEELPKDRELLVYCAGGYRSSIAASLLQQKGFDRVSEIAGGIAAWDAAKLRVHTGQGPAIRA
jgi:rhodanese-related sulfurtransferase